MTHEIRLTKVDIAEIVKDYILNSKGMRVTSFRYETVNKYDCIGRLEPVGEELVLEVEL